MNKYERLLEDLRRFGTGVMTCYGDSMVPILYSGCELTYITQDDYEVGDIVFCVVEGYWIDAHIITKKIRTRHRTFVYEISDSHGNINGRTDHIFGKVVRATYDDGSFKNF